MEESNRISELQLNITHLYDELTIFSYQCAFLCDAFASIPAQHESLSADTIDGIDFFAQWIKTRLLEMKSELGKIHEQLRELKGI